MVFYRVGLFHPHNLVAVYGAVVLADVQADGPDGALVGSEAHGVVLGNDLVGGLRGALAILQLQNVDGIGHLQRQVHAPVAGLLLGTDVAANGQEGGIEQSLVELFVLALQASFGRALVLVGNRIRNAGVPFADDLDELLEGLVLEAQVVESDAQRVAPAFTFCLCLIIIMSKNAFCSICAAKLRIFRQTAKIQHTSFLHF